MKASTCPSCGAPAEPTARHCEYCGSFLIPENDDENFSKATFTEILDTKNEDSVVCVCGRRLEKDEYPVRSGKANLYRSISNAAGGHLILTNRRFLFVDHGLNMHLAVKPEEESIYFDEVAKIKAKTVLFISKRLIIEKQNGIQQEYVVWNLKKWLDAIRNEIPHIPVED